MSSSLVVYEAVVGGALFLRRGLLASLERELRRLESEYARDVDRVREFERRYRPAVGDRYDELERLRERTSRGWEALGRLQAGEGSRGTGERAAHDAAGRSAPKPGGEARRLFLTLAREIHPDLASDPADRRRRHEVMAEATLAYRNGDSRRLQWLLEHWRARSEPGAGLGCASQWARTNRDIAWVRYRIREMQYSIGQLHSSPVARIMQEHDIARSTGRNLILEMRKQIQADLAEAYRDLDRLRAAMTDLPPGVRAAIERECGAAA